MRFFKRKPVTRKQLRNRKAWRKALLSGDYKQGQRFLVSGLNQATPDPRHCCIGVACEAVLGLQPVSNYQGLGGTGYQMPGDDGDRYVHNALMSEEVFRDTFGLDEQSVFSEANDHENYNFQQIADMIPIDRTTTKVAYRR